MMLDDSIPKRAISKPKPPIYFGYVRISNGATALLPGQDQYSGGVPTKQRTRECGE
jgi:hypothetical protein